MTIERRPFQFFLTGISDVLSKVLPIVGIGRVGYMKVGEGEVQ